MKNVLLVLAALGFAANAYAADLELQIVGSYAGGAGNITLSEIGPEGVDVDSTTSWALGGEVYYGLSDKLQLGGILHFSDSGQDGADTAMTLGGAVRYNLGSELRDSLFFGGGVMMTDVGDVDWISVMGQFGKRIALSDTLTWTPNVTVMVPVSGDMEGHSIALNIVSFSGFLGM